MAERGFAARAHPGAREAARSGAHQVLPRAAYRAGAGAGAEGLPVGIVTGIRGNLRYRDGHVTGRYGHAGAEPRESRQDAVLAGVEFVGRLEQLWLAYEAAGKDLVATVGQFHTDTAVHTMTKIPGEVWFSMDIRSEDNDVLLAIDRELRDDRGGDRRAARRDDRSRRLHQRVARPDRQGPPRAPRTPRRRTRHPRAADGERRWPRIRRCSARKASRPR